MHHFLHASRPTSLFYGARACAFEDEDGVMLEPKVCLSSHLPLNEWVFVAMFCSCPEQVLEAIWAAGAPTNQGSITQPMLVVDPVR